MKIAAIARVIAVGVAAGSLAGCQTAGVEGSAGIPAAAVGDQAPAPIEGLEIESFGLMPVDAAQGAAVEAVVRYKVSRAATAGDVKVNETYTIVKGQDAIQLSQRDVARPPGTHNSTLKFTLPRDLAKGDYTVFATVSDGQNTRTARASLRVM